MITKLKKKKNKKRKEKGLVDIRSSFGVGPQETPFLTTNLANVTQSECLPSSPLSEPGVDPHDRFSANITECDEHRFPDACVISWNMNGVQNFNKLRTFQKMVGSCQPLFILIQESHSDSKGNLDLIRNQLKKYIWLRDNSFEKRRGLLIGVRWMEGVKEISSCFFDQTTSGLFEVHVLIGLTNYSVLNIYYHPNLKVATISQEAAQFSEGDDSNEFLTKFKTTAWKLVPYWSVRRGAGSTEKTREKKEKQKLWIKTFMGKIPSQHKQNKKTTTKKQKSKKKNNKRNHN